METPDFIRPMGIETGVLLNNNTDALQAYKKAKKRMKRIDLLETEVNQLRNKISLLEEKINALSN